MEEESRVETNYREQHVQDLDSEEEPPEVKEDVEERSENMEAESTEKRGEENDAVDTEDTTAEVWGRLVIFVTIDTYQMYVMYSNRHHALVLCKNDIEDE